jgi:hypothetical protein
LGRTVSTKRKYNEKNAFWRLGIEMCSCNSRRGFYPRPDLAKGKTLSEK